VAFVDPRKSKIDIAQAAGRAMRQSKATHKKIGYIVVPLFIEQKKGETEAEAFTRAGFDEVAEVLAAMLESDDDLVDTIEKMQEARGRGDKFNPRQLHEKIQVIGPAINLDKLTQSIDIEVLDRLGLSWDRWFGLLQVFKRKENHCRVDQRYILNGFALGSWVSVQRQIKHRLSQEQISRLNSIGFSWDLLTERWEEAFSKLQKYREHEGHCRVPHSIAFEGINLGNWVSIQRKNKRILSQDQIKRLELLGFSWDPFNEQWEKGFNALLDFHKKEGHCRTGRKLKLNGVHLGSWVSNQRLHKSRLTSEQIARLDSIGFSWDPFTEIWEEAFSALKKFRNLEGHCRVTPESQASSPKLIRWVFNQRVNKHKLSPERIQRLDSIGFSWDPHAEQWEEAFTSLIEFKKREGHCRVPFKYITKNIKLGNWVLNQRQNKESLTSDRIKRLNSIGFNWDPFTEKWEEGFNALQKFHAREGHCIVEKNSTSGKLGRWVMRQRQIKSRLTSEQIGRLDSLGFSWDPLVERWEKAFAALEEFCRCEGHCNAPRGREINGVKLGVWINSQRRSKERLTDIQVKRLESLGFIWNTRKDR